MSLFAFANKILIYHMLRLYHKSGFVEKTKFQQPRNARYPTTLEWRCYHVIRQREDRRMIEGHSRRVFSRRHAWQDGVRSTTPPSKGRRRGV